MTVHETLVPVIEVRQVSRVYRSKAGMFSSGKLVRAVDDVSLSLDQGEILGIVGESGSGKSSLGELLLGLAPPASGEVRFCGAPLPKPRTAAWRRARAKMQLIYQDPLAALDPRLSVGIQIAEPLKIHRIGTPESRRARVEELARAVGLGSALLERLPEGLSGGQRQRAVIARAMATNPKLLVCDEPVSALDVSIQAQVVNTFRRLRRESDVSIVFISHDLKVVRNIAGRVAVMYLGRVVEEAPAVELFASPKHPYTQALLSSIPVPGKALSDRVILQGEPPDPASRPPGCAFQPRCTLAQPECSHSCPGLRRIAPGRRLACHVVDIKRI